MKQHGKTDIWANGAKEAENANPHLAQLEIFEKQSVQWKKRQSLLKCYWKVTTV